MPDTLADHQVPAEGTATDHQVPAEGTGKTFRDLEVAEPICTALEAAGITAAFPIQALAVPIALGGQDLIGQARTGTGKTLAFGVPLLQQLAESPRGQRSAPRGPGRRADQGTGHPGRG